jgi:hypothetical protein
MKNIPDEIIKMIVDRLDFECLEKIRNMKLFHPYIEYRVNRLRYFEFSVPVSFRYTPSSDKLKEISSQRQLKIYETELAFEPSNGKNQNIKAQFSVVNSNGGVSIFVKFRFGFIPIEGMISKSRIDHAYRPSKDLILVNQGGDADAIISFRKNGSIVFEVKNNKTNT